MGNPKTVLSVKVPTSVVRALNDLEQSKSYNQSQLLRRALYHYLDLNKHQIELNKDIEKLIENLNVVHDAEASLTYIEMMNRVMEAEYKKKTFLRFVDKFMADVYMANKFDYGEEKALEMVVEGLGCFDDRAEFHGYLDRLNARKKNPKEYVEKQLKRNSELQYSKNDGEM